MERVPQVSPGLFFRSLGRACPANNLRQTRKPLLPIIRAREFLAALDGMARCPLQVDSGYRETPDYNPRSQAGLSPNLSPKNSTNALTLGGTSRRCGITAHTPVVSNG